ncbi:MAG: hypothetical protein Q8O56_14540 [Solirubrobacteraceae bacterium]|nr:hypothetical protein [Solirubrobacteraceae bacterium]
MAAGPGARSNFGAIDADEDALLRECFQDHAAYLAAKSHTHWLIVGRKGSGKTAIFKRLITERAFDHFAYGHTFDDYPWEHHDLQAQLGVPEERRYFHSWKYLILVSLTKVLLNQDQSQPWDDDSADALEGLENFVVDSYGSRNPDLTQLFSPDRELKLKGSLRLGIANVDAEKITIRELPAHVQEVNASVQRSAMQALNPDRDYYICFDQLDLGFTVDDERYAQRLVGLLLAARDLNRAARDAGKRMSVIVFLRDDIYEMLQFEDKNKITENNVSRVEWNRPGGTLTLKDLMERRFGEVYTGGGTADWSDIFDENKQMPSRQSKYAHICDRTFLRPRDMIKFCNEVLDAYTDRHEDADGKFDNESVIAAREGYSEYLLRELDDEIAKHAPVYQEYLEVLKTIGNIHFTSAQFEEAWDGRPRLAKEDRREGLESLFEFSVIGYLKSGGGGGGSKYVWRYMDPRARFDAAAETYRVHAGFKEALDLVQRRARKS